RRDPFLDRAGRRREAPSLLRPSGHRRGRIMVLIRSRPRLPMVFAAAAALLVGVGGAMLGICGPFLDVAADPFCPYVLEIFTLGITTGTTPTTYDPAGLVNRLQMATFVSRTVDAMLRRGGRRVPLSQPWKGTSPPAGLARTAVNSPLFVKSDGVNLWVSSVASDTVQRVRASDGRLLETWTGAMEAQGLLVAAGRTSAAGPAAPGRLHQIDPGQPAGAVTTVSSGLGNSAGALAFDGARVWSANLASSVSIVIPSATIPWTVTTISAGFSEPTGILYDGSNVWVTDDVADRIFRLDPAAAILQTVTTASGPKYPIYDGANIWGPDFGAD